MRRWRIPGDNIVSSHPSCVGPPIIFFPLLQVFEWQLILLLVDSNTTLCFVHAQFASFIIIWFLFIASHYQKRRLDHVMGMFLYL